MLGARLLLGTTIVALLTLLCRLDLHAAIPGTALLPLALAALVAGGNEVATLAERAHAGWRSRAPLSGALVLLGGAGWLPHALGATAAAEPFLWVASALVLGLILLLGTEMTTWSEPGLALPRLGAGALALLYVGVPMSFLIQLRFVGGARAGLAALLGTITVVKASDIGAYAAGRLVGRRRLAPLLSPGKTVEGVAGGLLTGIAAALLVDSLLVPALTDVPATPRTLLGALAFALLTCTAGLCGDLAESLLKRDAARKDSSAALPGFGGVLDVLDSLLPAAPVAYLCWRLGVLGR
jgi:phosphatidate cytidylyltransferase